MRSSSLASGPRSTRNDSAEADRAVPARTSTPAKDTSASGSIRDRTTPPQAYATTAHGPTASRQTPHSTIATRPPTASVSRQ